MKHLNNDILCTIGIETSGPLPYYHDLLQFAIIPLSGELKPREDLLPFDINIKAGRPENIDHSYINKVKYQKLRTRAIEPTEAADLFEMWFNTLGLRFNKRIAPLGYDCVNVLNFIQDWLGPKNMERYIDYRYRDVLPVSLFLNDHSDYCGQPYIIQKVDFSYLCATFKIVKDRACDSLDQARHVAEIYMNLMKKQETQYLQHQARDLMMALKSIIKNPESGASLAEEALAKCKLSA